MKVHTFEEMEKRPGEKAYLVSGKDEDLSSFVRVWFSQWKWGRSGLFETGLCLVEGEGRAEEGCFYVGNVKGKLYAWVEAHGIVLDLGAEKKGEREKRYIELVKRMGVKREVAAKIVVQVGCNAYLLKNEVEKVQTFAAGREVQLGDVEQVVSVTREESVWEFLDALMQGQKEKALKMGKGMEIFPLLRQLRNQLQTDLQIVQMTPEAIQKKFPYMKGWVLEQRTGAAKRVGAKKLKRAILVCEEIDLLCRGTIEDSDLLIQLLIAKL